MVHEAGRINVRNNLENWSMNNSHRYSRTEGRENVRKERIKYSSNRSPRLVLYQCIGKKNGRPQINIDEQINVIPCKNGKMIQFCLHLEP